MRSHIFKLSLAALACSQVLNVTTVSAEESESNNDKKVIVTGSRIKQVDAQEISPVKVIGTQEIQESSADSLSELLKELSITHGGEGSFSTHNSGALQADSPVGTAAVSLRGLGASSTLVLVNGRRLAPSSFAFGSQNFIDINSIPLAAVERVEVLPSGASAIYGADAVAGVVNLILKQTIDKPELTLSYGNSEASSDDDRISASFVWGNSGERNDVSVFVDYFKTETLYDRDRSQTAISFDPSQQGIWPSFNTQFFDDIDYVESSCPDELRFDDRPGFPNSSFGEYCQYNQNAFLPTYPGFESISAGIFSEHIISPSLSWKNEFFISQTESEANSTSAPFSGVEVDFNHPNMPAELAQRFDDLWVDLGVPAEDFLLMWGRFDHPRTIQNESQSYRFFTGLDGQLDSWEWNAGLNYSSSESEQRGVAGIFNVEKFEAALFGELCADGTTGCAPGTDGLWYNPFGGQQANDQQVLDLLEENVPRDGESTLLVVDFNMSGDMGELENGYIASAFGVEFRQEEITDVPSALATADPLTGEVPVYGFGSTGASAERDVWAAYAEFIMPLAASFDLHLAGRYDHYSDFGGDFNPKLGFKWKMSENTLLRGSWNTSFRAPSLAQVGADTTLSSGALDCGPEFIDNFCGGFGGSDGYLSEIYGNPDLEAEESEAFDIGLAVNFTDDISMTLDYWSFDHDNIVGIDDENLFRQALNGDVPVAITDSLAVGEIGIETRDGTIGAPIDEIHLQLENLGVQKTSGIDFTYTHYFKTDKNGRWSFLLDGTYLLDYERQLSEQSEVEVLEGTFRYPELVLRAKLRWQVQNWTSSLTTYYTSSYEDDLEKYTDTELDNFGISREREIPSWTEVRLSVGYEFNEKSFLRLSIDNLFDNDAPLAYGTSANVDHFNHDTLGRFYRLTYTQNF